MNIDRTTFESIVRDTKFNYSKIIENEMRKGNKENLWSLNEIFDFTIVDEQESNEKFYKLKFTYCGTCSAANDNKNNPQIFFKFGSPSLNDLETILKIH